MTTFILTNKDNRDVRVYQGTLMPDGSRNPETLATVLEDVAKQRGTNLLPEAEPVDDPSKS